MLLKLNENNKTRRNWVNHSFSFDKSTFYTPYFGTLCWCNITIHACHKFIRKPSLANQSLTLRMMPPVSRLVEKIPIQIFQLNFGWF